MMSCDAFDWSPPHGAHYLESGRGLHVLACSATIQSLRLAQGRARSMSIDISRTIAQEGLENASGQVDAQLESDRSQVELSGLFRVTSHSELIRGRV